MSDALRLTRLRRLVAVGVAAVMIGACGGSDAGNAGSAESTAAPTVQGPATPTSSFVMVPAPSLAENMLGEPAELEVAIWLPASYAATSRRYPVVYFLAGFGESASTATIGSVLERLVDEARAPEMILVGVDGNNSLGGSFYVDSPVTGKWAQAIHADLVGHVDANYRTLPTPASRGIAGFSMGGFGALDLAMRHPDVFGSVYALSPGLFAPGGLETTEMFADDEAITEFLELQAIDPATDFDTDMDEPKLVSGSEALRFSVAYGSAFAPDPDTDFPNVAYPYAAVGAPRDQTIWTRWESGYGGVAAEVGEFEDNLRSLRGIALDYGTHDQYEWIPEGTEYLADQLAARAIQAQVTPYEGGHGPIGPRAEEAMFPFFAEVLDIET